MHERDIKTPRDLESALAARGIARYNRLWDMAEGRFFRWTDAVGVLLALAMLVLGGAQLLASEADFDGVLAIGLGLFMLFGFMMMRMQAQLAALAKLVRELEDSAR